MMKTLFQSMTTRVFLILSSGILIATLLTVWIASGERQKMIGQFRDFYAVERIAQFILSLETVPPELRPPFLTAATGLGMHAELTDMDSSLPGQRTELAAMLDRRLPEQYQVRSTAAYPSDCSALAHRPPHRKSLEKPVPCEAMLLTLQDGKQLRLAVMPPRPPPVGPRIDFSTYGIPFLLSMGLLAALIARMTMRPLKQLAQAATELGNNIERSPLPERGATEIRQAAVAFNVMQSRIQQHIKQRAHIVAAITHDLQTPLTRLRLRLEKVDDKELREKLIDDLSAMQGMVKEGLDLARSMDSAEPVKLLDLDSLIDSVCVDAIDMGLAVTVTGKTGVSLRARPTALRRCLTNLVDNAIKYGQFATVTADRKDNLASVQIRDGGPGIPDNELEKVFEPFYRIESSRSRETGGTGLGLTIARNIAEQHGGRIRLRNLQPEGLEVVLELPVSPIKQGRI